MLNAVCVLLGVAVVSLSAVCLNLQRRLKAIELSFLAAAERLGDPQYE